MTGAASGPERVLILAPYGRDAAVAAAVLREAGLDAEVCPDIGAVRRGGGGRGGGLERNPAAERYGRALGNVSFLERPFHPTTLVSIVQTALRGRRRQYE